MSGGTPCDIKAIWFCPFCGRPTWKIELPDQWGTLDPEESYYSNAITKYEDGREEKELVLRIECEDTKKGNSAEYDCPAMMESGAYWLKIRPDGEHYAEYF